MNAPTNASPPQWASHFLPNARILMVDDDRDFLDATLSLLKKSGAEVMGAPDGAAGLAAARAFDPDLVISDLSMPNMKGDELLAELRKTGYKKPFIMLTGYAEMSSMTDALRLNVFDYLVKPVSPKIFSAIIQGALRAEHERLLQEERNETVLHFLSQLPLPEGFSSWEDAIRARAIESVRKRRESRPTPKATN